jgi:hypothetical protein
LPSSLLSGLSSPILFPFFATGVADTNGKLPPVSLTLVVNLPSVSTTLAKLVAKFATSVVDTCGKPLVSLIPVVHLDLQNLCEFSKKFKTVLMGYSGAGGKLIHEKNQKQKIS